LVELRVVVARSLPVELAVADGEVRDALALHELRERLLDLLVEGLQLALRAVEVLADLDPLDLGFRLLRTLPLDAFHERDVPVVADLELLRELRLERVVDVVDGEVPAGELVEIAADLGRDVARAREEEVDLDRLIESLDQRLRAGP